jgi:hypothetical protein
VLTRIGEEPSVRAPFEFFVFRGEAHDSLLHEMRELNGLAGQLRARMEARERAIREQTRSADPLHLAQDEELNRLSERLDEVQRRSSALSAAMAESARESAAREYAFEVRAPDPALPASAPRVRASVAVAPEADAEFRPLTPYLLGRNRVAGAEVVDLKPELARYFEVDGGVLVVDVAPRTPAALAGLVPGDVIVRIAQIGVRSVEDLRFGVSLAGDTLPIALIREGESLQVTLRR